MNISKKNLKYVVVVTAIGGTIVTALALTGKLRLYPIKGMINKIFYKQSPESIVADKTAAVDTDLGVQRLSVTPFGAPERRNKASLF